MVKLTLIQIFQLVASALFLIGAVFMLVNTFADATWAFWVGLSFALVGFGVYLYMGVVYRRDIFRRFQTPAETSTETEEYKEPTAHIDEHEKNVVSEISKETKPKRTGKSKS